MQLILYYVKIIKKFKKNQIEVIFAQVYIIVIMSNVILISLEITPKNVDLMRTMINEISSTYIEGFSWGPNKVVNDNVNKTKLDSIYKRLCNLTNIFETSVTQKFRANCILNENKTSIKKLLKILNKYNNVSKAEAIAIYTDPDTINEYFRNC